MYMKINVMGDYSSILQLEIDLMVGKNLFHWEVFFVIYQTEDRVQIHIKCERLTFLFNQKNLVYQLS